MVVARISDSCLHRMLSLLCCSLSRLSQVGSVFGRQVLNIRNSQAFTKHFRCVQLQRIGGYSLHFCTAANSFNIMRIPYLTMPKRCQLKTAVAVDIQRRAPIRSKGKCSGLNGAADIRAVRSRDCGMNVIAALNVSAARLRTSRQCQKAPYFESASEIGFAYPSSSYRGLKPQA